MTNALARELYPEAYPQLARFVELLETDGVTRGLIGPNEGPRLWQRHIVNCAVLGELLPPSAVVVDMGSGAGLPGLVLAIVRPDLTVSLVDTQLRRVTFLTEAIEHLGLDRRCQALQGRFPAAWGVQVSPEADAVVARGLAPLPALVGLAKSALDQGSTLLALKGQGAQGEIDALLAETGTELKAGTGEAPRYHVELMELGPAKLEPKTTVVRVRQG